MSAKAGIAEPYAEHGAGHRSTLMRTLRDLAMIAVLALASAVTGHALNRFSSQPLPLLYQTPEQRFDQQLTTLVTAAPFQIAPASTVTLADLQAAADKRTAVILDARPRAFYERGHVPGARNLSRDEFARDYRRLAPLLKSETAKPIIVYCSGGACHDSRLIANALLSLGFNDVSIYTGGWDEWSAAHLPESIGGDR